MVKLIMCTISCEKKLSVVNRHGGPVFLHNNARPRVSQTIVRKLVDRDYELLPHLPFLADFIICCSFY